MTPLLRYPARIDAGDLASGGSSRVSALLAELDARDLPGATLVPLAELSAYQGADSPALGALLAGVNDGLLDLAAASGGRLDALLLLDVDDPAAAAAEVARCAGRGPVGAIVPLFPQDDRRYDSPRYAPLWQTLISAGLPLVFHPGTTRGIGQDPRPFDLALHRLPGNDGPDPVFDALFDAMEASYARLALVALSLSGTLARNPGLQVVCLGFGAGWVPYTLLRLDGQYEVRPERAGDEEIPDEMEGELRERHAFAPERAGFSFPDGERPSDDLRRHLQVYAGEDRALLPVAALTGVVMPADAALELPADAPPADLGGPLYSADCHVIEPPDLWTTRIDPRFRATAPRVVAYQDTELWVVGENIRMAVVGIQAQAGRRYDDSQRITKRGFYRDIPELTPDRYAADLDIDGVAGAVLFSSNAHQAYRCVAGDLLSAIASAYNDWVLEYAAARPDRLKAAVMLNVDDPAEAAAELARCAARGACGAMIPLVPQPGYRYDQRRYDVLWAAAQDAGVPLLFHVGSNQAVLGREPLIDLIRHGTKDLHVQASLGIMLLSGVFGRFPRLRLGVIEFEASWAPYLLERLDRAYRSGRHALAPLPGGALPSDHFRQGVFVSFQEDLPGILWRDRIGAGSLMWGSDYPHAEATFPRSREILAAHLRGVPAGDARKLVADNAAREFGFAK